MSYYVEIVRPIPKADIEKVVAADPQFEILEAGENWVDFQCVSKTERAVFSFAQGRISITSPSDFGWLKAEHLASQLGAEVIGEEDQVPIRPAMKQGDEMDASPSNGVVMRQTDFPAEG